MSFSSHLHQTNRQKLKQSCSQITRAHQTCLVILRALFIAVKKRTKYKSVVLKIKQKTNVLRNNGRSKLHQTCKYFSKCTVTAPSEQNFLLLKVMEWSGITGARWLIKTMVITQALLAWSQWTITSYSEHCFDMKKVEALNEAINAF